MRYLATITTTALILIAVLLPGSKVPDVGFSGIDKLAHFTLFYLWSLAIRLDFRKSFNWKAGWLVGLMFSFLTETLQILVEGRTFDYYDILFDTIGLIAGLLSGSYALKILFRYWPFKSKPE